MVWAAVARYRFEMIWVFIVKGSVRRTKRKRKAGTLVTKPMNITKEVKWPRSQAGVLIYIQQDNTKSHICSEDKGIVDAAGSNGFDVRLHYQPLNSPDMNFMDLRFFNAIQSVEFNLL